jgi:hypothetical protein
VQGGSSTDSVLTITNGVVKKLPMGAGAAGLWSLTGNASTDTSVNYIGTTDGKSLHIKTNAADRVVVNSGGNVGIGTASPTAKLDVAGTVKLGTSGTPFTNVIKDTVWITNTSSISTTTMQTATVTFPGAQVGGSVTVNPRAALSAATFIAYAYISATNQIKIVFGVTNGTHTVGTNIVFDVTVINP